MMMRLSIQNFAMAGMLAAALFSAGCAGHKKGMDGAGMNGGVGGVAAPGSPQEFQTAVGDRVFFDTDITSLSPQAQATLDKQAQWLSRYRQYAFTIEGHADERGTREYNLALGARRAASVQAFLISRGIAANRMKTVSYGKERPVAVCDDISCWSQNRRAVTVLNGAGS